MSLPRGAEAVASEAKIREYLLSDAHPVVRYKSLAFKAMGYSSDRWRRLRDDLLEAARTEEAIEVTTSEHGTKYRIRCTLSGSPEMSGMVDSIWLVGPDGRPRFITAYPAGTR